MDIFFAAFGRITVLFVFILAGYILVKVKALGDGSSAVLSKLENCLFIPSLVLGTFTANFTVEKISSAWKLFWFGLGLTFLMMIVAKLISNLVSKDKFTQNIYTYGLVFSNFGFMGNAVVSVVFPEMFLEYLIFTLPMWTMIYVWGVPCLLIPHDKEKGQSIKDRLRSFVNPMFVAMLIGIVIGISGLKIPQLLNSAITMSGDCMSPVSMILTGVIVAQMDLKKVLGTISIYIVTFIRLLALPLAAILSFAFINVPDLYVMCCVCALSMPLGLNIMVIPSAYGKDTSLAAGAIIVSHLLSLITIPLIFALMMTVL